MVQERDQKRRVQTEMQMVKTRLLRFQKGQGPLESWARGLSCYVMVSTFCLCPVTGWEAEFKGNRLINLVEETLRQYGIQMVTWLWPGRQ